MQPIWNLESRCHGCSGDKPVVLVFSLYKNSIFDWLVWIKSVCAIKHFEFEMAIIGLGFTSDVDQDSTIRKYVVTCLPKFLFAHIDNLRLNRVEGS